MSPKKKGPKAPTPAPSESGRRRARHAARTSLVHSTQWMLCVNTHYPSGPSGATRSPRSASSTHFEGSQHRPLETAPSTTHLGQDLLARIFNTFQSFIQCYNRIFEVFFPKCSSCLVSSQDVVFPLRIAVLFSRILGCLHFPEGVCFLGLLWLLNTPQPCTFLCKNHTTLSNLLLHCLYDTKLGRRRANLRLPKEDPTSPSQCG